MILPLMSDLSLVDIVIIVIVVMLVLFLCGFCGVHRYRSERERERCSPSQPCLHESLSLARALSPCSLPFWCCLGRCMCGAQKRIRCLNKNARRRPSSLNHSAARESSSSRLPCNCSLQYPLHSPRAQLENRRTTCSTPYSRQKSRSPNNYRPHASIDAPRRLASSLHCTNQRRSRAGFLDTIFFFNFQR